MPKSMPPIAKSTPRARRRLTLALAALLALGALVGCGSDADGGEEIVSEHAAFGYEEENGPERWAELDASYETCDSGKRQSPIDLSEGQAAELPEISFSYRPAELELEDNGHSLVAAYPPGSSIELDGAEYALAQFHFHAPSEHRIDGASAPMEFHLVHESEQGELLVLGALVEEGRPNPAAAALVEAVPDGEGENAPVPGEVDALDLLPPDPGQARRWSYPGSLTTPPCDEGVSWHVFAEPIELSADQIEAFTAAHEGTNRPPQPLNGRPLQVSGR